MSATVKMAVIGVGLFGEEHASAYSNHPQAKLVCVCDKNEARARQIAEKYRCEYTTRSEEVAASDVDGVSIATPDFAHLEPALQMIAAKKNLLIEKPLAVTLKEAQQIDDAAKQAGIKLMVDFHNRWNPPFVEAKNAIRDGKIGQPTMGYARLSNAISVPTEMLSWSTKSGPQWFLLPHIVDLMRWLVDAEATEVFATGTRGILEEKGIDAYDTMQVMVRFGNDRFVTFETAWILPNSWPTLIDFKVNQVGSAGQLSVTGDNQGLVVTGEKHKYPFVLGSGFVPKPICAFVDSLVNDTPTPTTGRDGVAATAIIEAAMRSLKSGSVESVEA
jgi:predicted dehydrogenase